jgi:DNA polymerase-3 subunit epsilon
VRTLRDLEVLIVDVQATAASPKGHMLELGWARMSSGAAPRTRLIRLPPGERIPPAVARITGISDAAARAGIEVHDAFGELAADAASLGNGRTPTVIHFARFEEPFIRSFGGDLPLEIACTHEIARRLLPGLPRRSLRALTGYFGRAVGQLRRSAEHVEATAFVWRELVPLLEAEGVTTWSDLRGWLAVRPAASAPRRRVWPMPREARLAVPDAPGIYRMLRTSGDVLYVGKAASLRHRVNSYFRKQRGIHERTLEMLSQARGLSFEVTPTTLEAALLEPDEIKRHRPPYNVALTGGDRALWFAPPDLSERSPRRTPRCTAGPFPSAQTLDQFMILAKSGDMARRSLGEGGWAPAPEVFEAGYARFCGAHAELSRIDLGSHSRLLRLGTRLWAEGRRDHDGEEDEELRAAWTPELVQLSLEWLVLRAALARRRARWLTRLAESTIVWSEPGGDGARLIVIENGEVAVRAAISPCAAPPVPPGHSRAAADRHAAFTIARYDRLRVLTTELKRLTSEGAPVALRFGETTPIAGPRLAHALTWV